MYIDFLVNQKYGAHNLRQLELSQMVVHDLIIDLGLPLSIVEHPAFVRAMNTVDPKFNLLSRRTLCRETLPSTLEQVMMKVKQACSDAKFVALTLDIWTDRRMRAFIGTTMHTIAENDGTFENYLLTFQPFSGKLLSGTKIHSKFPFQDHIQVIIYVVNSKPLLPLSISKIKWFE